MLILKLKSWGLSSALRGVLLVISISLSAFVTQAIAQTSEPPPERYVVDENG